MDRFELRGSDVYEMPGPLDYASLFAIASLPARSFAIRRGRDGAVGLEEEADLFAVIRAGTSGAPPVRELRRDGGALHPRGGRRPGSHHHQDDGVPPRRRHAVRVLADQGRGERQAGRLPGGAEGSLRRGTQPALGGRAAEGRCARDPRRARPQDAHQAGAGGAAGGRRAAHLRARRHRQLPRQDCAHVHDYGCSPATR